MKRLSDLHLVEGIEISAPAWAGYVMKSKAKPGLRKALIGNLTLNGTAAELPQAGFSGRLEPGEYRVLTLR